MNIRVRHPAGLLLALVWVACGGGRSTQTPAASPAAAPFVAIKVDTMGNLRLSAPLSGRSNQPKPHAPPPARVLRLAGATGDESRDL